LEARWKRRAHECWRPILSDARGLRDLEERGLDDE
jgi:hypothetical protein